MTQQQIINAHKAWAEAFLLCNIRPAVIKHPAFLKALRATRSNYVPPDEDDDLLLASELDGETVCIASDGSDNNAKVPVQHVLAHGTFGVRLVNVIYHPSGTKMDAQRIFDDIVATKNKLFDELSATTVFGAYLHDNENKQKAAARLFEAGMSAPSGGCSPHGWNKVFEYVFKDSVYDTTQDWCNEIVKKVNKGKIRGIVTENILYERIKKRIIEKERKSGEYVLTHDYHAMHATCKQRARDSNERVGFPNPGETRKWANMVYLICFVTDHEIPLKKLFVQQDEHKEYIKDDLLNELNNEEEWQHAQAIHHKLLPLRIILDKQQKSDCNLGDAYYDFKKGSLEHLRGDDDEELFKACIEKGFKLCSSGLYYAVVSVDPRFASMPFTQRDLEVAEQHFEKFLGAAVWDKAKHIFYSYRIGEGAFAHQLFTSLTPTHTKHDAIKAWKFVSGTFVYFEASDEIAKFINYVTFILSTPTGISATEGSFCDVRRFHDWFNAVLSDQKLSKMVRFKFNWNARNGLA